MRYRPLGKTDLSVSAVSLALTDMGEGVGASDWAELIYSALEEGINLFEIVGQDPAIRDGMGQVLKTVDRRLLVIGLRQGRVPGGRKDFSAETLSGMVEATCLRLGTDYLDFSVLHNPGMEDLPAPALRALKELRDRGRLKLLGVAGANDATEAYMTTRAFDVLVTPYNLLSGWKERNRIKMAQELNMAVIGLQFFPDMTPKDQTKDEDEAETGKKGLFNKKGKPPPPRNILAGVGGYGFLETTPNWTAEEICLSFALTEPGIASTQISSRSADRLPNLAAVTEREMAPGAASRIEMARFGALKQG